MTKKVSISAKPALQKTAGAEEWIKNRAEEESTKRLTIDVPESLHRAVKAQCAARGTKIAEEVRELLLQKYGQK